MQDLFPSIDDKGSTIKRMSMKLSQKINRSGDEIVFLLNVFMEPYPPFRPRLGLLFPSLKATSGYLRSKTS